MSDAGAPELSPAYVAARRRRLHQVLIFALCLMSLLAYANSFRCGFAVDNRPLILEDTRLRAVTQANLGLIFTQHYWARIQTSGLYRPVTTLSYLFNYAVLGNGTNPAGYHAVNLALQCLNIALVYLLAWRIFGDFVLAFATAALWGVHPLLTESVTNIVGRADLLAGSAVLGGLLCHIRGAEETGARWRIGLAALATIGLFSKESVVVLPALMLAYDFTFRPNAWHTCRPGYLALLPPLALWWWARSRVLLPPLHPAVDNPLLTAGFWTARLTAIKIAGRYLWLLVFPRHLSFDYSYNQIPLVRWHFNTWEDWQALVAVVLCAVLLATALLCYWRYKPMFFWMVFGAVTFAPTSNLIVLIGSVMAERFMYLPTISFAACVVAGTVAAGRRLRFPALAPAALALLCLALACRTFARNFDWRSDESVIVSGVSVSPNSFKTHRALAYVLSEKTPPALDQAMREIERSIEIQSSLPDSEKVAAVYAVAGQLYRQKGESVADPAGSVTWYRKSQDILLRAVSIDRVWKGKLRQQRLRGGVPLSRIPPVGAQTVYLELGNTDLHLNEPRQALDVLNYGRKLDPYNIEFYGLIGNAYAALHEFDQQAMSLLEAVMLFPTEHRLTRLLRTVYTHVDTGGCPAGSWDVIHERLSLNLACPSIQQQVCTARNNLARLLIEAKQEAMAERIMKSGPSELHCPQ